MLLQVDDHLNLIFQACYLSPSARLLQLHNLLHQQLLSVRRGQREAGRRRRGLLILKQEPREARGQTIGADSHLAPVLGVAVAGLLGGLAAEAAGAAAPAELAADAQLAGAAGALATSTLLGQVPVEKIRVIFNSRWKKTGLRIVFCVGFV